MAFCLHSKPQHKTKGRSVLNTERALTFWKDYGVVSEPCMCTQPLRGARWGKNVWRRESRAVLAEVAQVPVGLRTGLRGCVSFWGGGARGGAKQPSCVLRNNTRVQRSLQKQHQEVTWGL